MLVLSRKVGQEIILPDSDITITVVELKGNRVKLGIKAPAHVPVHRSELLERLAQPVPLPNHVNKVETMQQVA